LLFNISNIQYLSFSSENPVNCDIIKSTKLLDLALETSIKSTFSKFHPYESENEGNDLLFVQRKKENQKDLFRNHISLLLSVMILISEKLFK
jgi:hypothetical protein